MAKLGRKAAASPTGLPQRQQREETASRLRYAIRVSGRKAAARATARPLARKGRGNRVADAMREKGDIGRKAAARATARPQ